MDCSSTPTGLVVGYDSFVNNWNAAEAKYFKLDQGFPIRQCYDWGSEGDAPNGSPGVKHLILMASYSDGNSVG